MEKQEVIDAFVENARIYGEYLPKLRKLVFYRGYLDKEIPGSNGDTYGNCYQRDLHHFELIYNAEQLRALESKLDARDLAHAGSTFFEDFEEASRMALHVDELLMRT